MKLAAIDIGSNSIHLIIAHINRDGSYEVVDKAKDMVGLASKTLADGYLSEEAFVRGMECLNTYRKIIDAQGVDQVVAVATSAVREAANSEYFVELAREECDIDIDVIPGEEEARLIYLGARDRIDWGGRRALIIDIGGGSVEFIVGDRKKAEFLASLKLGVRRLSEEFLHSDPPTRKQLKALCQHIEKELGDFAKHLKSLKFDFVVGTSGTLKNLSEIVSEAEGTGLAHTHGASVGVAALRKLARQMSGMTLAARSELPGLDAKRTDTIVAGAQLIKYILRAVGHESYITCNYALRDGLVVDYIERNRHLVPGLTAYEPEHDIRRRAVLKLFRRFNQNGVHPKQVARLALMLFDQLQKIHELPAEDRDMLEYAALLHDIGYTISHRKHHKHSAYMIQNGELYGFTAEEIQYLALLARYHRGSNPRDNHEPFRFLTPEIRLRVVRMTALLRLANALDRSHTNNVMDVSCTIEDGHVHLNLSVRTEPELEMWALRRNASLFVEHFQATLTASHQQTQQTISPWVLNAQ